MQEYRVHCPLCESNAKSIIRTSDTRVIYHIAAFHTEPNRFFGLRDPDPEAKDGADMLISHTTKEKHELKCDEEHHLEIRSANYDELRDGAPMLYGPAERPKVKCPNCRFRIGEHDEYVYRWGDDDHIQYILRNVSLSPRQGFSYVESMTRPMVLGTDQVYTTWNCDHCGSQVFFNFSNKRYDESEKYHGTSK